MYTGLHDLLLVAFDKQLIDQAFSALSDSIPSAASNHSNHSVTHIPTLSLLVGPSIPVDPLPELQTNVKNDWNHLGAHRCELPLSVEDFIRSFDPMMPYLHD